MGKVRITEYLEIDSLFLVRITVMWAEGRRPYSISVDTMFDGIIPMEEEAAGTTAQ